MKNVPILFPKNKEIDVNMDKKSRKKNAETLAELEVYGIGENGISQTWRKVLEDNASLLDGLTCLLEESEVLIDIENGKPVCICQYPVPQAMKQKIIRRDNEWRDNNWVSLAPDNCQWNSLLLPAQKMVEGVYH